jgi:nucleoside-diphosphate-sugar epimerase
MRVIVIGGTRFIGRAVVAALTGAGHEVLLVHRGEHEPAGLADVPHLHANRRALGDHRDRLAAFAADALVDVCAMTGPDAEALLDAVPGDPHLIVASSQDVYQAFASLLAGQVTEPVPLDEDARLRTGPLQERRAGDDADWDFDASGYEKLDVERAYLARGGTVLRLPFTYGEHDYQRREEAILRRVRAGRPRIPVGPGTLLWSKSHVGDIAEAVRLTVETPTAAGAVLNLAESRTVSMGQWAVRVLEAAGATDVELVKVDDKLVPPDLLLTTTMAQHVLIDSSRARALLGWSDTDPVEAGRRSVRWHLANPPSEPEAPGAFEADDRALKSLPS